MSGKSTFMRQVAVIVLMAQIGCFVPAGYVFIDGVPQPLGTGFRGEGQTAFTHLVQLFQKFGGEVVHPQGGKGQIDLLLLAPL